MDLSSVQNAAILKGLDSSQLGQLAAIASELDTREGERLFTRGQKAETFFIAKRGRFALTLPLRVLGGETDMAVEEKGALDAFGWSSLVEPHESIYSAFCTFDGTVFAFSGSELRQLMRADDALGRRLSTNLNALVAARVRAAQDLWIDEVEHSIARVNHWTQNEMSNRLHSAVKQQSTAGDGWRHRTRGAAPADRH
ncbi:MAG: cyclic nucleotide-binding domain-containing protein [Deltaproteobacteria bacterium]|nr:cyclic nucleotide-binding domain-containing protein [Deltaproteobacteria bacterium]